MSVNWDLLQSFHPDLIQQVMPQAFWGAIQRQFFETFYKQPEYGNPTPKAVEA